MLIVAMILTYFFMFVFSKVEKNKKAINKTELQKNNFIVNRKSDVLKYQILRIYHSQKIKNKREKLVELLRRLSEVEDTSDFLEENYFLQKYIFKFEMEA